MSFSFNQALTRKPKRSIFKLNHNHKFSAQGGVLIPTLCEEVMPGDTIRHSSVSTVRLQPLQKAMMHKVDIKFYDFFIPMRLLWDNYEKFFANPVPSPDTPVFPYYAGLDIDVGSKGDYLGLPTNLVYDGATGGVRTQHDGIDKVSCLQFYAYEKAFFDWFIPRNLVDSDIDFITATDGENDKSLYGSQLRYKSWRKDYFTSALPEPQAGAPVVLPIGDVAPVVFDPDSFYQQTVLAPDGSSFQGINRLGSDGTGKLIARDSNGNPLLGAVINPNGTLIADLADATGVDIESLRWAVKLQEFLEKNARGGTRYIELMLSHFGVRSSDARLQRSELVSVNSQPIVISEVLQTAPEVDGSTPLGEMGGHGLSVGRNGSKGYFCEEHGYYMTFACVVPQAGYFQGIPRQFSRFTPLDFPWPSFAHLGAQEILSREIYYAGNSADDDIFGYTDRYNDKRVSQSRVSGDFRTTLANWHMDRIFQSRPVLSDAFVACVPTQRVFVVVDGAARNYLFNISHKLKVKRALPLNSIPAFG